MTDLKDLKELAEAATPGPWEWEAPMYPGQECYVRGPGRCVAEVDCGNIEQIADDNAAFIAAANPKTVLELIARVEAAEGARDVLSEALDSVCRERDEAYDELEEDKAILKDIDEITAANAGLASWSKAKDEKLHELRTALEQAKAREAELLGALDRLKDPYSAQKLVKGKTLIEFLAQVDDGVITIFDVAEVVSAATVTAMGGDDNG